MITNQQDALATMALDEISSEQRWEEAFAQSQDVLAALAQAALKECAAGKTTRAARAVDLPIVELSKLQS